MAHLHKTVKTNFNLTLSFTLYRYHRRIEVLGHHLRLETNMCYNDMIQVYLSFSDKLDQ